LKGDGVRIEDAGGYDWAVKRWLPVRSTQIRNDGREYAYAEPYKANSTDASANATHIHVVSLVDGSDRVIYSGPPRAVVSFEPDGIYATAIRYYSDNVVYGLWRLDPVSGASTEIPNVRGGWVEVVDGTAWTDGAGAAGTIYRGPTRIDLPAGSQQPWEDMGGLGWLWFAGLDSRGNPLGVQYIFGGSKVSGGLVAYIAPKFRVPIAHVDFHQFSITDSHGTWLAGPDGIYLLDANDELTKVSDVTGGTVAGGCN